MKRFLILSATALLAACAADETIEPPAELVEFQQKAEFERVWSRDAGDLEPSLRLGLVPAVGGDNVYVASPEGQVTAFRIADGEKLWEFDTSEFRFWGESTATRFSAGPEASNGRVVIGALNGDVLMLDAATGEKLWQENVNGELLAPPLMQSGLVTLRTTDGRLVALDARTGEQRWDTIRDVPTLVIRGHARPTSDGQRLFAGFDNGKVAALNMDDGSMVWEATIATPVGASALESIVDVDGDLVQFGKEIYATSYNGHAAALAVESGEILWRRELSSVLTPAVGWGNVFVTDADSAIHAFDRLSGTTVWSMDDLRARSLTAPALFDDLVVVGDFEGYLHFLDVTSGELVARIEHDGEPLHARPVVAGELLLVLSGDGELSAYRRSDRQQAE